MEKKDYQYVKEKAYQFELLSIKKIWIVLLLLYACYYFFKFLFLTLFLHSLSIDNPKDNYLFGSIQILLYIPLSILSIFSLYYIILKLISMKSLFYPEARFLKNDMINKIILVLLILIIVPQIIFASIYILPLIFGNINYSAYLLELVEFPTIGLSVVLLFNFFILKEFFNTDLIKEFLEASLLLFLYPIIQLVVLIINPSIVNVTGSQYLLTLIYDPLELVLSIILFILSFFMYLKYKRTFVTKTEI